MSQPRDDRQDDLFRPALEEIINLRCDGDTLDPAITDVEKLTRVAVRRIRGDKGYRGHNYPDRFRGWISGQVRRVTKVIR